MVTINLKVSMCRDIIANSNMTKAYVINPCDSCNNDVNTPLNAIHVHIYSDYVIHFECTCIVEEKINYRTACTSDTFCAKLVRATSVRVLPKCRPMIVYKKEKLPHFFELHS